MDIVGSAPWNSAAAGASRTGCATRPIPLDYPQDYVYVTGLNGYELGREPSPGARSEHCPPQSPQKRERVPQDMFDPILRRFAETLSARARCATAPSSRRSRRPPSGVVAQVRDVATGETRDIAADYLVGTDGGASTVRERARHHHERQRRR